MSHTSPAHTLLASASSSLSPAFTSSSAASNAPRKVGRPNNWTPSRQRELARLYLYSILPPEDIPKALKVEGWQPGFFHLFQSKARLLTIYRVVSTGKTVKTLLNHDPRWLRPKNREEMDERILILSERKAHRKIMRKRTTLQDLHINEAAGDGNEFLENQADDLLPMAIQQPLGSILEDIIAWPIHAHGDFGSEPSVVLPRGTFSDPEQFSEEVFSPIDFDMKTVSTQISTTSLKKRLSQYSTQYIKAIARVMKAHSISDSSAATIIGHTYPTPFQKADDATMETATVHSTLSSDDPQTLVQPVLANVFLNLDNLIKRQGFCVPGLKSHDSKTCWCHVTDDVEHNMARIWVSREGLHNFNPGDGFIDQFGNTVLHMVAARYADINSIVSWLEQSRMTRNQANARNAAGQTFLHVFPSRFLRSLQNDKWNGLIRVLQKLNKFEIHYLERDVFGRNFFHLLTAHGMSLGREEVRAIKFLGIPLTSSRDAFGCVPFMGQITQPTLSILPKAVISRYSTPENHTVANINYTATCQIMDPHPEQGDSANRCTFFSSHYANSHPLPIPLPPGERSNTTSSLSRPDSLTEREMIFMYKHARLLEIAHIALDMPDVEDAEGRNGLHCLAEVSLSLSIDTDNISSRSSYKRKRDQSNSDSPSMRLKFRYELVSNAILAGVDINHYDKKGNTVLMSFVIFLHDGEDDKILSELLHHLINRGANLHWRNRRGETALHIAVRLGRKVATKVLLQRRANVHARTLEGKGVLAIGEMNYFQAKYNQSLYASIHACMALAIKYRATATPTLVDEWRGVVDRYVDTYVANERDKDADI